MYHCAAHRFFAVLVGASVLLPGFSWPSPALAQTGDTPECREADQQDRGTRRRRRPGEEALPECPADKDARTAGAERRRPGEEQTERRRPGAAEQRRREEQVAEERRQVMPRKRSTVPRPGIDAFDDPIRVPDRWRIVDALYEENWWDPYNRNLLKADKPIHGDDWFFNITAFSDTLFEARSIATPVGVQSSDDPRSNDVFGGQDQFALVETLGMELAYIKGDTVFRPPDYEFRLTPVFNYNHTEADEVLNLRVDPRDGTTRNDHHVGLQAAFFDYHIRNVSDRYDFDSIRIGIQPFNADFRGFLFQDDQLGVRLFGTRDNNIFQYNLAWFRRLEKDINSGLNNVTEAPRDDDVFVANLYWQDMPKLGFFSQFTAIHNRNRENDDFVFDTNGFIQRPASLGTERPRAYDVTYLGYSTDGHIGRLNLTSSLYYAFGEDKNPPFRDEAANISAGFFAGEASMDFDWIRPRLSFLYATGDGDPFDDASHGFDAIFENPQFAGAETSYWIRQAVPLVGGGRVTLSPRNGVLNSLRSSKERGQSNFTNPGMVLAGLGADFDVLPELRVSFNANQLWFDKTEVLEVARNQPDIGSNIGMDLSVSVIWRPLMTQNIVVRASYAALVTGNGYESLFPDDDLPQSVLANIVLTY